MTKQRVVVLISGGGSNLQALMDACVHENYPAEIVGVISNKADAFGLQRAEKAAIPTTVLSHKDYADRETYDAALHDAVMAYAPDYVCLAGFMRLLTAGFVSKWQGKMINIHPSLLPAFKGLHTHQRALDAGVKYAGCTVHFVVPEMDEGPIIAQAVVPVLDDDTAATLAERVLGKEHEVYVEALRLLAQRQLVIEHHRVRILSRGA